MNTFNRNNLKIAIFIALRLFLSNSAVVAQTPDNAALLYYQAFLLYEKPDATMDKMLSDFLDDKIKANEVIEQYIERNRKVIDFMVTAANTPSCDWGYDYSQGLELAMPNLGQLRQVTYLMQAEAKLLAEQGDYKTALDRCLSMHKMGLHAAGKTFIGYLVAIAISGRANSTIQDILKDTAEDLQTLDWLKNQLAEIYKRPSTFKIAIDFEKEVFETYMTREKFNEVLFNKDLVVIEASLLKIAQERFLSADEQFFVRNRDYWQNYFAAVKAALDMPYPQAFAKLKEIEEKVKKDVIENPDATATAILVAPFARICSQRIRAKTNFNAIRAAIELYIIKAKTGRLPDKLPADLPKDLFSSKPFEYKKTDDGFILRCQGKDLSKDEIYEYEFKIKK
jgi:hypothetical protein